MNDFDGFGEDETYESIVMKDENGDDVEFYIIDVATNDDINYLLVINAENVDDEETEAIILKETSLNNEESFYDILEEGEEFSVVSSLFQNNDNYEIEL